LTPRRPPRASSARERRREEGLASLHARHRAESSAELLQTMRAALVLDQCRGCQEERRILKVMWSLESFLT
jgi:hypothetical protein